ncbi:hypothetical protein [Sphingomonas sp. ABOLG]|uniref:hypothetical protein n=1 Tax=Sphingomonas sp. ABOLG TaxID=1985880 RepID=UPI001F49A510|nr:hypothetical protein [Sphingomonas sp. ABOLG]
MRHAASRCAEHDIDLIHFAVQIEHRLTQIAQAIQRLIQVRRSTALERNLDADSAGNEKAQIRQRSLNAGLDIGDQEIGARAAKMPSDTREIGNLREDQKPPGGTLRRQSGKRCQRLLSRRGDFGL